MSLIRNRYHWSGVLRLNLRSGCYEWDFLAVAGSDFTNRGAARRHNR